MMYVCCLKMILILGNDLVKGGGADAPVLTKIPEFGEDAQEKNEETFPVRDRSMLRTEESRCVADDSLPNPSTDDVASDCDSPDDLPLNEFLLMEL